MDPKQILTKAQMFLSNNSQQICTGIGVVGVVSTTVMAVKATPKACYLIDLAVEQKIEQDEDGDYCGLSPYNVGEEIRVLGLVDTVKAVWKCYIPTVITGGLTIACFIAAYKSGSAKQAAIASAYSLVEKTLKDYQEKVIEIVGEDKDKEIKDAVAKKWIDETKSEEIIPFGNGVHLCYDSISGRYFKSDVESIRSKMNDFNHELNGDYYSDLNYWYIILDLPSIAIGHMLGWNANRLMDINFSSQIAPNGEPCIVLDYGTSQPSPFYREGSQY